MRPRDSNRLAHDSDLQELLDLLNVFAQADEPAAPADETGHERSQQEPEHHPPTVANREQREQCFPAVLSPYAVQDNRFAAHFIRGMEKLRDTDKDDA
jgi:hypothetical protein